MVARKVSFAGGGDEARGDPILLLGGVRVRRWRRQQVRGALNRPGGTFFSEIAIFCSFFS